MAKGRNRTCAFSGVPEFTPSEEYVERHPLRANMVHRSHDWEWSSLKPTARSGTDGLLCDGRAAGHWRTRSVFRSKTRLASCRRMSIRRASLSASRDSLPESFSANATELIPFASLLSVSSCPDPPHDERVQVPEKPVESCFGRICRSGEVIAGSPVRQWAGSSD